MTVNIVLVTQEGCTPCKRVKRILSEIEKEVKEHSGSSASFEVEEVDFSSELGMKLAVEHQILYPPALFIGGQLFGKGKIREDELREAIRLALSESALKHNIEPTSRS